MPIERAGAGVPSGGPSEKPPPASPSAWGQRLSPSTRLGKRELGAAALLAVFLVALSCAYVVAHRGFLHRPDELYANAADQRLGDHFRYIAMASGPDQYARDPLAHQAPFAYRLLTPWLAYRLTALGIGADAAFYSLSQASLVLFLFALFVFLRRRGFSTRYALLGMALAGLLQGATRWYAFQYWMTDPLALLLLVIGFVLVDCERDGEFAVLATVGVMNRESHLILFPYFALRRWRSHGFRVAALRTIAALVAPLMLLGIVHYYIVATPRPDLLRVLRGITAWRWEHPLDFQLYYMTLGSFGVLMPLLLLFPRRWARGLANGLPELAVVAIAYATLAISNNTDRLLAYALPAVLPAALGNLRRLQEAASLPFGVAAGLLLAAQLLLWLRSDYADCVWQPFDLAVTSMMAALWIAGLVALRRRGRAEGRDGQPLAGG